MALDLAALRAKLAAQKEALNKKDENETKPNAGIVDTNIVVCADGDTNSVGNTTELVPTGITPPAVLGTAKTSEIDHLDFISKMNALQSAIHKQHPTMPVLLMQIHKQLRADEELVSTLSEEAIGIIVKGLQIQTKTELVSVVVKESKSKKKKEPISVDMF